MTVKQIVSSFNLNYIDTRKDAEKIHIKINNRTYTHGYVVPCADKEASFHVSMWSDGSMRVEIWTK